MLAAALRYTAGWHEESRAVIWTLVDVELLSASCIFVSVWYLAQTDLTT